MSEEVALNEWHPFVLLSSGSRTIESEWHGYVAALVRSAVLSEGLWLREQLDTPPGTNIATAMCNLVQRAEVVVVDVTSTSPNVFFELGLATALGRPVLVIASDMLAWPLQSAPQQGMTVVSLDGGIDSIREALRRILSASHPSTAVIEPRKAGSGGTVVAHGSNVEVRIYNGPVFMAPVTVADTATMHVGDIQVHVDVRKGDDGDLQRALDTYGLSRHDIADLLDAAATDEQGDHGPEIGLPGPEVQRWWTRMTLGAGSVSGKVVIGASGGLVAKAVSAYLGIG